MCFGPRGRCARGRCGIREGWASSDGFDRRQTVSRRFSRASTSRRRRASRPKVFFATEFVLGCSLAGGVAWQDFRRLLALGRFRLRCVVLFVGWGCSATKAPPRTSDLNTASKTGKSSGEAVSVTRPARARSLIRRRRATRTARRKLIARPGSIARPASRKAEGKPARRSAATSLGSRSRSRRSQHAPPFQSPRNPPGP